MMYGSEIWVENKKKTEKQAIGSRNELPTTQCQESLQ
jgi:hypothetical protein